MLGWLGLLLFFLIWLGERTQIDTITQIPDKVLHGQWNNIIWINCDGMNIVYSWCYWFGILILVVFLWKLIVMLVKGEKPSPTEKAINKLETNLSKKLDKLIEIMEKKNNDSGSSKHTN